MTVAEFEALYERHLRAVWAAAYARRLESEAALDIAQEAFCRLWKHSQVGEVIRHPRAWLMRVARNLAEDDAKSAFRRNGTLDPRTMSIFRAATGSPLEQLVSAEQRGLVRRWLRELAPADREILTMKYALDYDTAAIAESIGVNEAAVHMRLSRARKRLAQYLTDRESKELT